MTEEQAYAKLQELLSLADEIVGEHYGAVEIIKELMNHMDIGTDELE
jgi:hypothetical protein